MQSQNTVLPMYHPYTGSPVGSPARPSFDGLNSRRSSPHRPSNPASNAGSPLRSAPGSPASRGTGWAGDTNVTPVRRVRRPLNFGPNRSTRCSTVEATLCLTGVMCILVFFALYDHEYSPFRDSAGPSSAAEVARRAAREVREEGASFASGGNVSAYTGDVFSQHWEGKRCEQSDASGELPQVIVIGAHKAGSTALFSYLAAHGGVRPAFCKEAHFFDWKVNILRRDLGLDGSDAASAEQLGAMRSAYRRFFRSRDRAKPPFVSVEGTPSYFHAPEVPARVRRLLPDVQLVATLRNPVDRAISHFMGQKAREFKRFKSCSSWFDEYAELVSRCDGLRPAAKGLDGPTELPMNAATAGAWAAYAACVTEGDNPVARGMYAPQLYNWLSQFPARQIRVIQSENLFAAPSVEMERLTDWLGMRPHFPHEREGFAVVGSRHMQRFNAQFTNTNVGAKQASFAKVFDCDKRKIADFYNRYEDDLFDLLYTYYPREVKHWTRWSQMPSAGDATAAPIVDDGMDRGRRSTL